MKRKIMGILMVLSLILVGCAKPQQDTSLTDFRCKDTPLAEGCFIPSNKLDFVNPIPEEYTISETFELERVGQMPRNWLLYRNEEYKPDGVSAKVVELLGNKYVEMYSDGLQAPMYPQSAPTPTFIFTTKFNLDQDRKGVAFASVMIPSDKPSNSISLGIATGAVNTIGVTIGADLKVNVKVGGPFFYYSSTGDGGTTILTNHTLSKDQWYTFKYEWDAAMNTVSVSIKVDNMYLLLHQAEFHISNRVNATLSGAILVPNVFKVTMPRNQNGYAYLDNVIIERWGFNV